MVTIMAAIEGHCQVCGSAVVVVVGQYADRGRLRWHRGYSCGKCGNKIAEDGIGMPPGVIRRAVLAQEGQWMLVVHELRNRARALSSLRQALRLTIPEIGKLAGQLPGPAATGTKAEVVAILHCLRTEDVAAAVEEVQADPAKRSGKGERDCGIE
jgi:hypothetical protein